MGRARDTYRGYDKCVQSLDEETWNKQLPGIPKLKWQ